MMIENRDLRLIAATRPMFSEHGELVAGHFYKRLFKLAPDLRGMFPDDLTEQGRKLSATLALAVTSLQDWEELAPILAALARRHIVYGVQAWHYAIVTQALLDTLTGLDIDDETVTAWNRAMSVISTHMIAAAYGDRPSGVERLQARPV